MISNRTMLSLAQYLELQEDSLLSVLFEKHGLDYFGARLDRLVEAVRVAQSDRLHSLLEELFRTEGNLRYNVNPKYVYDERRADLIQCFLLDGYRVDELQLIPVDPTIEGDEPLDDDLTAALLDCPLPEADEVIRMLDNSADAFRHVPPDYNACLTEARVALQTITTAIAKERQQSSSGSFDESKWGQVVSYLRTSGLITVQEEKGITGVFSFVSPGAHQPVGLTEEEMTRLGRTLTIGMIYFLVKRHSD